MENYFILNLGTGEKKYWSLYEILCEINRDHSDEYTPYDLNDWREGWHEWCEGQFYQLLD